MIDFKLWLEAKRKKKAKKIKPLPSISHDIDSWLHELELLSKDLEELQKAKKKFDLNQSKKKSVITSNKKKSVDSK